MDRPNFHFRRREEKLDWKKLAALDVDQITKNVDYKALQDSIRQITYCDSGKEFDSDSTDPNLIKVFRMSQLIIEYLLQSQDFLANNLASVEQRLNTTLEELEAARQRSRRDQEELRDVRKGLRAPASSTVMTLTGHQRCHFCQKVFINTTYLQSHMMRRHNHMASKQLSNQTLSTVTHDQTSAPPDALVAELEQVRRRLLVAEQQLREERHRVASLENGSPYQPTEREPSSPTLHHTIEEEPEPLPEDSAPAGHSAPGSGQGSAGGSRQGSAGGSHQGSGGGSSQQGSGSGSKKGSGSGSQKGSGSGSQKGSGSGSQKGSGGGSQKTSGGGSQKTSGGGSPKGSGGGSRQASATSSGEHRDSQLAVLLEQQAAEIRQLREELERQRYTMQQAASQSPAPSLLGGAAAAQQQQQQQQPPEPGSRVEQEIQKQARRDVVAIEGQMEAQERYWQSKLGAMRDKHDSEVDGMRQMLNEKNAASRGSAEYVNIDSGPEQSPRLLRYVHRHQSPSPGPPQPPPQPPQGRGARPRPRPCIARQQQQRRSRSVSGCRRLKFADDEEECEEEEPSARGGPPRESFSSDALSRSGDPGGQPRVRQELETELSERLLELGIEPGTRRITSGLMSDKMKHLQFSRQVLGFGDLRRQVDQDVNQRLTKFVALPSKRTSKLALFAKDIMHRGAEMSRSLVTLGNSRGRVPCTSATIDAQLMKRMVAAEKASGRQRSSSDSPGRRPMADTSPSRRAMADTSPSRRAMVDSSPDRRAMADTSADWPRDDRDWQSRQQNRYEATSYDEGEDFRPRQGGRKFKFKANASKHILERFTRRGQCQSSLIKSTTIHRVESGDNLDSDGGDPSGRYEKLREEKPPAGRQGSSSSLAARRASAERQASSEAEKPSAGFGVFQGSSEKLSASRSGSVPGMSSLKPEDPADEGFVTPMTRPSSGSGPGTAAGSGPVSRPGSGPNSGPGSGFGSGPGSRPGSGPGSGPGSVPGSGPGSVPGSGPGSVPVSGPGSGPGSRPGSGPISGPGSGPGSVPVSGPGSVPVSGPGSVPVSGPGSVPGSGPGSVPGSGLGSGLASPTPPAIPQMGSDPVTPKEESFDDSEMSNQAVSSPPPNIPTMDPVDARPSGSANTLSTSQWNSAADGGAAVDSSAADETETRTSHTTDSSSGEETDEDDEEEEEDETETGDQ